MDGSKEAKKERDVGEFEVGMAVNEGGSKEGGSCEKEKRTTISDRRGETVYIYI